jgi:hypothetical protein
LINSSLNNIASTLTDIQERLTTFRDGQERFQESPCGEVIS